MVSHMREFYNVISPPEQSSWPPGICRGMTGTILPIERASGESLQQLIGSISRRSRVRFFYFQKKLENDLNFRNQALLYLLPQSYITHLPPSRCFRHSFLPPIRAHHWGQAMFPRVFHVVNINQFRKQIDIQSLPKTSNIFFVIFLNIFDTFSIFKKKNHSKN